MEKTAKTRRFQWRRCIMPKMPRVRTVRKVVTGVRLVEPDGWLLRRAFPPPSDGQRDWKDSFDPFVQVDELGPFDFPSGHQRGGDNYPLRAVDVITWVSDGSYATRSSKADPVTLGAGDVSALSAASGVIYNEQPAPALLGAGGRLHGMQVWVLRPGPYKEPTLTVRRSTELTRATADRGKVHATVFSGAAFGVEAPSLVAGRLLMVRLLLEPRGAAEIAIVPRDAAVAYVLDGTAGFGDRKVARLGQAVFFEQEGDCVRVENPQQSVGAVEVLLLAAPPVRTPLLRHGPLVATAPDELARAVADFAADRYGILPP
jgi:redox-sensitive bicupin YhaK (pirin superfamily)